MSDLLTVVAFVTGLALVAVGVAFVSLPVALIVGGLELVLVSVGYARSGES